MRLLIPPPGYRVVDNTGRATTEWQRWIRQVWEVLGFSPQVPMFGGVYVGGPQMEASAGDSSLATVDGSVALPQLRDGNTDSRVGCLRLGNDYREGSDITPYVEWMALSSADGDVRLRLSYGISYPEIGSAVSEVTETITSASIEAEYELVRASFTAVTGTNFVKGTVFPFEIARIGGDAADTHGADAVLVGFGLKYEREGLGHEEIHP